MLLTFNFFLAILIFCFRCLKEFQFSPDVRCSWCQMSFLMLVSIFSLVCLDMPMLAIFCEDCMMLQLLFGGYVLCFYADFLTKAFVLIFCSEDFAFMDKFLMRCFQDLWWFSLSFRSDILSCLRYNNLLQDFSVQVHWLVRLVAFSTVAIYPSLHDFSYVIETDAL